MKITTDEVKYVANLAKLYVDEAEAEKLTGEMESIINFADMLAEIDTESIAPTNHAMKVQNVFREDIVEKSYSQEDILKNAPSQEGGCYLVPKVVE